MRARLARHLAPAKVRSFTIWSAWLFIVVSLAHLVWVVSTMWGDPSGPTKLYHTVVNGLSYDAVGLTYAGVPGLLAAIAQLAVVGAAAVASTVGTRRFLAARRTGHVILCGWSGVWLANLAWLATVDGQILSYAQALVMLVLFACTVGRAFLGWSPGGPGAAPVRAPRSPDANPPLRAAARPHDDDHDDHDSFDRVLRAGLPPVACASPPSRPTRLLGWWSRIRAVAAWRPRRHSRVAAATQDPPAAETGVEATPRFWPTVRAWASAVWSWIARATRKVVAAVPAVFATVRTKVGAAMKWLSRFLGRQADRLAPATQPQSARE